MATVGLRPVVEQVVDDKVHKGEMFTAHDVTLDVRNKGHKVGHHEVRDTVHDYFQRGGMGVAYTRTTITVPAGGTPFLYHRTADDPATYGNIRGQGIVPNVSTPTISVPPPSSISSTDEEDEDEDDEEDDNSVVPVPAGLLNIPAPVCHPLSVRTSPKKGLLGRTVDKYGRLSVPPSLVRGAGFKAKDQVYASGVGDTIEVTLHPTSAVLCRRYTVDKYCHVRLTQSVFKRAGLGGAAYDVSGDASKVVVKLHK